MRIFGFLIIAVSLFFTIMFAFFGLPSPSAAKGLIDVASFTCVMGPALGGCLIAYGSKCGTTFKIRPNSEESAIAVSFYKLAVRISIGAGFIGTMFGWIAMLGAMGAGNGMDMGALTGGAAVALITALYGLVFAFTLFLPLQCYFQHQLGKDS